MKRMTVTNKDRIRMNDQAAEMSRAAGSAAKSVNVPYLRMTVGTGIPYLQTPTDSIEAPQVIMQVRLEDREAVCKAMNYVFVYRGTDDDEGYDSVTHLDVFVSTGTKDVGQVVVASVERDWERDWRKREEEKDDE